jgi:hypothetical protein
MWAGRIDEIDALWEGFGKVFLKGACFEAEEGPGLRVAVEHEDADRRCARGRRWHGRWVLLL